MEQSDFSIMFHSSIFLLFSYLLIKSACNQFQNDEIWKQTNEIKEPSLKNIKRMKALKRKQMKVYIIY